MLPPELGGVAVVVAVVDDLVEAGVELPVQGEVGEVERLDLGLDRLQPLDVGVVDDRDEPAGQRRLDQHLDLDDVAHEALVDRPDPGAAVGLDHHEALAAQELQRLADRVGRGAVAGGELGDLQPLVRPEAAGDDLVAEPLVDPAGLLEGLRRPVASVTAISPMIAMV